LAGPSPILRTQHTGQQRPRTRRTRSRPISPFRGPAGNPAPRVGSMDRLTTIPELDWCHRPNLVACVVVGRFSTRHGRRPRSPIGKRAHFGKGSLEGRRGSRPLGWELDCRPLFHLPKRSLSTRPRGRAYAVGSQRHRTSPAWRPCSAPWYFKFLLLGFFLQRRPPSGQGNMVNEVSRTRRRNRTDGAFAGLARTEQQ
jgi:hypothetical protein